jgi:hypothetical protein
MIESILFTNQDPSKVSLNDMAIYHKIHCGIELTRQGIAKRFTKEATRFVKLLLIQLLRSNLSSGQAIFTNTNFNRILIKDSTCNQLPENLKKYYPGSGGASSKASVRIQFEYDLKNQEVTELSVSAFNSQDSKNAKSTLCNIQKNDLLIRDLAYTSIEIFESIENKKAWYISRLNNTYDVYDKDSGEIIDFEKLEQYMRKHDIYVIEKEVLISSKKHPVRLVIELVPDQVKAERIRKAKRKSVRNRAKTSKRSKARFGLNLFITNCSKITISASEIRKIYGIRWQIELVFKAWKQNFQFQKVKKINIHRYEFLLYVKLVMVLLTWKLHQTIEHYMFKKNRRRISVLKLYKTINQFNEETKRIIRGEKESVDKLITYILDIAKGYLLHDDRKDRINWLNVQNI